MAKKPDDEPEPEVWTPDKPLPDEDDEAQVQRRLAADRRMAYLREQAEKGSKKPKGKGEKAPLW